MNTEAWIACAAAGIALLLFFRARQKLMKINLGLTESFQEVDRFMKKRVDIHVSWAEVVAVYDLDAQGILAEAVAIRDYFHELGPEDKCRLSQALDELAEQMMSAADRCPRLRTSDAYMQQYAQAEQLRREMPDVCAVYNEYAGQLNKAISRFPVNITALLTGFEQRELFAVTEIEKKSAVS